MPRSKQYKYEAVLEKAMDLFWAKGYNGTSIQELVSHVKLSKTSMYEAFTDKHGLFMATLHNYRKRLNNNMSLLREIPSARAAIELSFESIIAEVTDHRHRRGGYLTNTAIELAPHDKEVEEWVNESIKDIEKVYTELLQKGIKSKEFSADMNIESKVNFIMGVRHGILVYSKIRQDKTRLQSIVTEALKVL
ncbi:MAG: hypothetical protein BGO32_12025 [Bacteroidetes bacterium 37-13]|nr:MAG: hypothetical protein BGO32_12025 [Bacteroidetes bacterium 37-13]